MRTSETINELATALAAAQGEMSNALLNKVNPHFRNRYADLAAVREATIPALSKHKLAIVQSTGFDGDGTFMLVTRLLHSSGQWLESSYPLPIAPDKPQVMGSAQTYARRYSWTGICGIASEEDDDASAVQESKPASVAKDPPAATFAPNARERAIAAEVPTAAQVELYRERIKWLTSATTPEDLKKRAGNAEHKAEVAKLTEGQAKNLREAYLDHAAALQGALLSAG